MDPYDPKLSNKARELCISLGLSSLGKKVRVVWNKRLKTTAGRAFPKEQIIELNPKLKDLENAHEEIERTFLHELAHLTTYARYPICKIAAHGIEWQQACVELGIPGERASHQLPFNKTQYTRKFKYICPNCELIVYRVRKFKYKYACSECCKKFNKGKFSKRFLFKELITKKADQESLR